MIDIETLQICLRGNRSLEQWREVHIPTRLAVAVGIEYSPPDTFGNNPVDPVLLEELKAEGIEPVIAEPMITVTAKLLCEKLSERIAQLDNLKSEKANVGEQTAGPEVDDLSGR